MDENNYTNLAKARIERAKELLQDAELLLGKESYASANNRAYYALEKACTALLASEKIQTKSHRGIIAQFNQYFVSNDNTPFGVEDYKTIARAESIRSKSDYDDFYVAKKDETKLLISNSGIFIAKVEKFLKEKE